MDTNTDFLKIEHPGQLSDFYELMPFDSLILSFCADTPRGTTVEVEARVKLTDGRLTEWFSWGVWSPFADRHSKSAKGRLADLETDTLRLHKGLFGNAVQVRVKRTMEDHDHSPLLRRIVLAVKNSSVPNQKQETSFEDLRVDVPSYSQMVREPSIGPVICSATTIAILLNHMGENVLPEEIALLNYDSSYEGCGNWSFSTAIASSYGYDAYVRYATLDDLVDELRHNHAVGVSVSYTNQPENDSLPFVEGAPCRTPGHLLVLCGFQTTSNGIQYAIVHDPAAQSNETVERFYPLEQFMQAWSNRVIYVVHREEQVNLPRYIPERVSAEMIEEEEGSFSVFSNGERVLLKKNNPFDCVAAQITQRKGKKDADCVFSYGTFTQNGRIRDIQPGLKTYVITNRGVCYYCN